MLKRLFFNVNAWTWRYFEYEKKRIENYCYSSIYFSVRWTISEKHSDQMHITANSIRAGVWFFANVFSICCPNSCAIVTNNYHPIIGKGMFFSGLTIRKADTFYIYIYIYIYICICYQAIKFAAIGLSYFKKKMVLFVGFVVLTSA